MMPHLSSDQPVLMEYIPDPEQLDLIHLKAVYLPIWLTQCLESEITGTKQWYKALSDYRLYVEAAYPDVIFLSFSKEALMGIKPFVYSLPIDDPYYYDTFIRYFALYSAEELGLTLPETEMEPVRTEIISLWEASKQKGVLSAFFAHSFSLEMNSKQPVNDGLLPTWVRGCGTDSFYRAMQMPRVPKPFADKASNDQIGSVYVNFHESYRNTLFVFPSYARYISRPLIDTTKNRLSYNAFPRGNNRSVWVFSTISQRFFAVSLKKTNDESFATVVQSSILPMLNNLNLDVSMQDLMQSPPRFYPGNALTVALIPYLPEDSTSRGHYLKSGISHEQLDLLKMAIDEIPGLKRVNQFREIVFEPKVKETLGGDGVQYPIFDNASINHMQIVVYSRDEKISQNIEAAVMDMVPPVSYRNKMVKSYPQYQIRAFSETNYQFIDVEGTIHFSIEFIFKEWSADLFHLLPNERSLDQVKMERKSEIKDTITPVQQGFALIEIDPWHESQEREESQLDPKPIIVSTFRELGYHTQCFHQEEKGAYHNRLLKSLYDLMARTGITGHLAREMIPAWPSELIYFCSYLVKKGYRDSYLPVLMSFEKGIIKTALPGQPWMDLSQAILLLGNNDYVHRMMKLKREGIGLLIRSHVEPNSLIVSSGDYTFEILQLQNYKIITYHVGDKKTPIAYKISKRTKKPSAGNILFEHAGIYYSIGSRFSKTSPFGIRDEVNEFFRRRATFDLRFNGVENTEDRDNLAYAIHLMRHISLTFDPATNQPYPIHLLRYLQETIDAQSMRESIETE